MQQSYRGRGFHTLCMVATLLLFSESSHFAAWPSVELCFCFVLMDLQCNALNVTFLQGCWFWLLTTPCDFFFSLHTFLKVLFVCDEDLCSLYICQRTEVKGQPCHRFVPQDNAECYCKPYFTNCLLVPLVNQIE